MKIKPVHYWFLIFAISTICYQQIQDNIRPHYNGNIALFKYFLGVAPNFFPAIGLPALFIIMIPYVVKIQNANTWIYKRRHIAGNLISMTGLIVWEFVQITGKLRFDWNDIIWIVSPSKFKAI